MHHHQLESQFLKMPYDDILDQIDDYAELAVQFGYASIFVVSYPITPLVAFVSNLIEVKIDAYKLLRVLQRAVPVTAEVGRQAESNSPPSLPFLLPTRPGWLAGCSSDRLTD